MHRGGLKRKYVISRFYVISALFSSYWLLCYDGVCSRGERAFSLFWKAMMRLVEFVSYTSLDRARRGVICDLRVEVYPIFSRVVYVVHRICRTHMAVCWFHIEVYISRTGEGSTMLK